MNKYLSVPFHLAIVGVFLLIGAAPLLSQVTSALVIGDRVRMRSEPSLAGKVVGEVNYWDVGRVLEKTKEHYTLEEGGMKSGWGWSWYHIETEGGEKGWVYGQFIAESPGKAIFVNEHFRTGSTVLLDREFVLHAAASMWYDEPVDDGPYFDETRTVYYFVSQGKMYPIEVDGSQMILSKWGSGKPDCLYSNGKGLLVLGFTFDYMDGSERVLYTLELAGDHFEVKDEFTSGVL